MADNSRASLGTQNGDTFAFNDIDGVKYPRTKLIIGAPNVNDGDVSAANPLPVGVSGTVTVDGSGVTQPVSGTFWQTTQPVSGSVTVSGAVTASGTVTANQGTAGATAWPVDGSGVTQPISATSLPLPTLAATSGKQDTGNTSLATIATNTAQLATTQPVSLASLPALAAGANVIGHVIVDSGTVTTVSAVTSITNALPAGSNVIGHVVVDSGTITAVTGITNALPAGTNVIGHVIVDSGAVLASQSGAWNITDISGTVSLPTGAATDTLQTSGNASLSAINGKLPALGAAATAASVPVNIASDQTVPISSANLTTLAALSGAQGASATAQPGVLGLAYASDNPPQVLDGNLAALSVNPEGRLRVSFAQGVIGWFGDAPLVPEFGYTTSELTYV